MIIKYNNIEKESEKAVKVNALVKWSDKSFERSFWMPKSVISIDKENMTIDMKDWFYNKLCQENMFGGYMMEFTYHFAN